MNDSSEMLQYTLLFSYLIVLPTSTVLANTALFGIGLLLALLRLGFASRFWKRTTGEQRIFIEIFLSDLVFLFAFSRALLTKRLE